MINILNNISRNIKISLVIIVDIFAFILSVIITSFSLQQDFILNNFNFLIYVCCSTILIISLMWFWRLYKVIFRYIGLDGIIGLFKAVVTYAIINCFLLKYLGFEDGLFNHLFMHSMLFLIFGSIVRILSNFILTKFSGPKNIKSVMIYGAGTAGRQLAGALLYNRKYKVFGFFDDDINLDRFSLGGLKVYHSRRMYELIQKFNINEIILAIPSLPNAKRFELLQNLSELGIIIKTLPHLSKILSGTEKSTKLLNINISDLLFRDPIKPINNLLKTVVKNKIIVVTGAGGSIGSEICRQIVEHLPEKLILIDISEASLYKIEKELIYYIEKYNKAQRPQIISLINSVLDKNKMQMIISKFKPDIIYHSAAYKHVDLVERNCAVCVENNIFGTINMADIALKNKIKNFILISTDKSVRPTNIMGASKRVCEMYIQALNQKNTNKLTKFSIVRFGNVLESSGSVVPLFREQIKNGGPVTITHKDAERYFMTIPEASQLVIQSTALSNGGEVFILGMGDRVKIYDLAIKMIHLGGLKVKQGKNSFGDIEIKFTGLRPGEKLYEELLINNKYEKTKHKRIFKAYEDFLIWNELISEINILREHIKSNDVNQIKGVLKKIVKEYVPIKKVVDFTSF